MICFALLFCPSAFRFGIGTDYFNYYSIFGKIKLGKIITQEPGWYLLNLFIIRIGLNFQWVIILSSFFTIYYIFKTPKKDFFVVVVLFFCLYYLDSYNATRQALAMSICWYSYLCYIKSKKIKSYIYILIAITFHYSAIVFLIVTVVFDFFYISKKKNFTILIIILFIFSNSFQNVLFWLISFTPYSIYIKNIIYFNQRAGGFGNVWSILIRYFILLWMCFSVNKSKCAKGEYSSIQILTVSLLFFDILGVSLFMFQRIRMFFFISYIALMRVLIRNNGFENKLKNSLFIVFFILYYFVLKLITGANAIIPYECIRLF
jgi:hypothetical protein